MARFKVEFDSRAIEDLTGIRDYIAGERGSALADRFIARVFTHFAGFEIAPFRGQKRDDIDSGLRIVGWRKTLTIAFTASEPSNIVKIVAVIYRGRDIEAVLRERTH